MPALPSSVEPPRRKPLYQILAEKCKEQPLVPLGVVLTCGALYLSGRALRARDSRLANRMFFWRVGFQAFTVVALVGGGFYFDEKRKEKKSQREQLIEKAKEREKLWIEELERIEEEAKRRKEKADDLKRRLKEIEDQKK